MNPFSSGNEKDFGERTEFPGAKKKGGTGKADIATREPDMSLVLKGGKGWISDIGTLKKTGLQGIEGGEDGCYGGEA